MKYLKLLTLFSIGLLTACSGGSLHLEKQGDLDEIIKNTADAFSEENIKQVSIYSNDALSDNFRSVRIIYKREKKYYAIEYNGRGLNDPRETTRTLALNVENTYRNAPSKKVSDFTMDNISELYKKGVEQLDKEQNGKLTNFVLANVTKSILKDGSFKTSFTINCTKKGESSTSRRTGRTTRVTINYYSVYVDVQKDGSLKLRY